LHGSNPKPPMSAMGQKTDIGSAQVDVRFTPKSGHCRELFKADEISNRRKHATDDALPAFRR
jgi:hypothetical protein